MAKWQQVAQGTSFGEINLQLSALRVPKGTQVQVKMDVPWGMDWLFDAAGAEWAFAVQTPDGLQIIDVYGESGQGIVDMVTTQSFGISDQGISAGFFGIPWVAVVIAGILIITLLSLIVVFIKLPAVAAIPLTLLVGAAIGVVGLILLTRGRSP